MLKKNRSGPKGILCVRPFSATPAGAASQTESKRNGTSPLAKIAVGLVHLDYSAEVVEHTDLCPLRARERGVLRVRARLMDRVVPCIPDRTVSKPIAD